MGGLRRLDLTGRVGFWGVPSGYCVDYIPVGGPGAGSFPKTGTFSSSQLTGPTPAGGAIVSDLFAQTSGTITSGRESATVEVLDNTTGSSTPLLACTVTSSTKNNCSNTGSSGLVSPGERLEVKVTVVGSGCSNKAWWVTFRR